MRLVRILLPMTIIIVFNLLLVSCGENASGVAEFKTINATVTVDPAQNPLLSDLATWTGDPCAQDSTYTVTNDLVDVTVTSTKNIANGTSLPLILQKVTITLTPADTISPPLPSLYTPSYQNLNGIILQPGESLSLPIEVATHMLKQYFGTAMLCTAFSPVYTYNATLTFDAVEQGTGENGSMSAGMTVRFADFAD